MQDFFNQRVNQFHQKYLKHKQSSNYLSLFRGLAFIAGAALLIHYFSSDSIPSLLISVIPFLGLFILIHYHKKEEFQTEYFLTLSKLNQEEIQRLDLHLKDFDPGEKYKNEEHPYAQDLDLFGQSSLYQLLNRCKIKDSKDLLARWMTTKANYQEIFHRQDAVKELADSIDFSQQFQAISKIEVEKRKKNDPNLQQRDLEKWTANPVQFSKGKLWKALTWILIIIMISAAGLFFFAGLPHHIFYLPLILNGIFLTMTIKYLRELTLGIDKSYFLISTYQKAIGLTQQRKFKSKYLNDIQKELKADDAHQAISKLASLTHRLSSRANILYGLLDAVFLLDAFLLTDLYHWRLTHRDHIFRWFQAINKMECLISLGGFAQSNPRYAFPKIKKDPFHFEAQKLGHPLIHSSQKVKNDYQISGSGQVDIITGSNMSGKSTFQRTVGINMVLAQMGAPVDAESLNMSLTHIFTSMRTRDNLAENTSSFYAELKRIHQLLEELEKHPSTFFLLDEILKGTNSEDRHKGAVALAGKLTAKPAFGMISTHDLALGNLEKTEKKVRNFSFNSTIRGNEILFDYKLTPGTCTSFNASKLMEKMGIM